MVSPATALEVLTPLLALSALVAAEPLPRDSSPPFEYTLSQVLISLERTACEGPCPVYQVTIHGDGTIHYNGIAYVDTLGDRTASATADDFFGLLKEFYRIDFFSLRDSYSTELIPELEGSRVKVLRRSSVDAPGISLSLGIGNYKKRVAVDSGLGLERDPLNGAPLDLWKLADLVDRVAGTQRWIGGQ